MRSFCPRFRWPHDFVGLGAQLGLEGLTTSLSSTLCLAASAVPCNVRPQLAIQPPTDKHVSQIARDRYQTTLRTDQLHDYDRLHATRHATGAKVSTGLRDDDDGDLDRQERARLNPTCRIR